jgi:tRNA1(Val) A37 N6-methylase TrmN6
MSARAQDADHTVDAFHRGRFHLVQPARRGHRAGLDAMILAGAVPSGFTGRLADLGAGAGGAGLAVLSRCEEASALLVEREEEMAEFARRSLAHPDNSRLSPRAHVLVADVTVRGEARNDCGLATNSCGFAIMNPPFNEACDRASPDALRAAAHVKKETMFADWVRTAAAMVRNGGGLAIIARPASLAEILAAIDGRFGSAELLAIHPRPGMAAIRIVLRAWRGRRGALAVLPALCLHEASGNDFTSQADAIINGRATLFGD